MRTCVLLLLALVALVCANSHIPMPEKAELDGLDIINLFQQFKTKYNKNYAGSELQKRYKIFKANILHAHNLNRVSTATFGVTKFSDLTPEEFRKAKLMPPRTPEEMLNVNPKYLRKLEEKNLRDPLPKSWDWRKLGAVTRVKDQQQCGSCWAFSVTGAIEAAHFLQTKKLVSLSEQNLVDCDHFCSGLDRQSCDQGCNGGFMENAMEYVIHNGGIDTEESYPYEAYDGKCRFRNDTIGATISAWSRGSHNETILAAQLMQYGSISIGMDATTMQHYQWGMLNTFGCSASNINHGILIVGFGSVGSTPSYWIVKNSWGSGWGESGYFRVTMGSNACGLAQMPVIAHV